MLWVPELLNPVLQPVSSNCLWFSLLQTTEKSISASFLGQAKAPSTPVFHLWWRAQVGTGRKATEHLPPSMPWKMSDCFPFPSLLIMIKALNHAFGLQSLHCAGLFELKKCFDDLNQNFPLTDVSVPAMAEANTALCYPRDHLQNRLPAPKVTRSGGKNVTLLSSC